MAAADAEHEVTRLPASLDRMTDADEIAAGDTMARRITESLGRSDGVNAATEAYLQQVGSRVAVNARRKMPYIFHYIPSPGFVNAFAIPGGHFFVGQGLLRIIASEDALAAVLGHEVEHIDLRHCAERAQQYRAALIASGMPAALNVRRSPIRKLARDKRQTGC